MPDDITTRAAKLLWAKLPAPHRCSDEIDEAARAVVALVLGEAANVADGYGSVACDVDMRDAILALGDKT